ncbi:hypothetical protein Nepgr_023189 [Nepenthes gracilis]|uniref:Uncharacterized protein n=1 Tax=Nepenthes gracilis TaxID=150966 RepID=A0AAD3T3E2_NEPGR|nr:hypothetical protein Nepgr_023189 [Nepenthes gracilis]
MQQIEGTSNRDPFESTAKHPGLRLLNTKRRTAQLASDFQRYQATASRTAFHQLNQGFAKSAPAKSPAAQPRRNQLFTSGWIYKPDNVAYSAISILRNSTSTGSESSIPWVAFSISSRSACYSIVIR